jgi:hypothetical protein
LVSNLQAFSIAAHVVIALNAKLVPKVNGARINGRAIPTQVRAIIPPFGVL